MRLSELLRRVTPELPDFDPEITFITDDSRKVKPGWRVCSASEEITLTAIRWRRKQLRAALPQ